MMKEIHAERKRYKQFEKGQRDKTHKNSRLELLVSRRCMLIRKTDVSCINDQRVLHPGSVGQLHFQIV